VPINARILAATNRDLGVMAEQGRFRKDLYYRLNVVNLRIPSLRDRKQDIPLLAAHFLERMRRQNGIAYTLSDEALRTMIEYSWPGNVRELENSIERACALSSGPVLNLSDLPTQLQEHRFQSRPVTTVPQGAAAQEAGHLQSGVVTIAEMEKQAILSTIRQLNGDKLLAARLLGIGKTTLYRKLKEYGLGEEVAD
jgi:DNA-binding NtrC family response regulator